MTPVRFAPEVPDELAEAVLWYEARRSGLGEEFLDEIDATLPLVESRPRSFPRLQDVNASHEIRRALLARFPYAIVFLVRQEEVRVLARFDRRPATPAGRVDLHLSGYFSSEFQTSLDTAAISAALSFCSWMPRTRITSTNGRGP